MNEEDRNCVNVSQHKSSKNVSKRMYSDDPSTPTRRSTRIQNLKTSNDSCTKGENDSSNAAKTGISTNEKLAKAANFTDTEASSTFFQVDDEQECFQTIFDDIFEPRYSQTLQSLLPKNLNNDSVKERKFFKRNSLEFSKLNFPKYICNKSNLPTEDVSKVFKIISKPNVLSDITTEPKSSSKPALKTYSNKRKNIQKADVIESFGLPDCPIAPENIQPVMNNELDVAIQDVNEITILDVEYVSEPWIITADGEDLLPILDEVRMKSEPIQEHFTNNASFIDFSDFENFMEPNIFASTPFKSHISGNDKSLCTLNSTTKCIKTISSSKEIDIEAIKKNFKKMLSRTDMSGPTKQFKVKNNSSVLLKTTNSLVNTKKKSLDSDISFLENESLITDNKEFEFSKNLPLSKSNGRRLANNNKYVSKHNFVCARRASKIITKKSQVSKNNKETNEKKLEKNKNVLQTSTRKLKISVNKEKIGIGDIAPKKISETDSLTSNSKCISLEKTLEHGNSTKSVGEHGEVTSENNKRVLRSSLHNPRNLKLSEPNNDGLLNNPYMSSTNEVIDELVIKNNVCKSLSSQTELEENKKTNKTNAVKKRNNNPSIEFLDKVSDIKITLEKCHYKGKLDSIMGNNIPDDVFSSHNVLHENDNVEKLLLPLRNGKKSIPEITVILNPLDITRLNKKPENFKHMWCDTLSVAKKKLPSKKLGPYLLKPNQSQEDMFIESNCDLNYIFSDKNLDITSTVTDEIEKKNIESATTEKPTDTTEVKKHFENAAVKVSYKGNSQKTVSDINIKRKDREKDILAKADKSDEVDTDILNKNEIITSFNSLGTNSTERENLTMELEKSYLNHPEIGTEYENCDSNLETVLNEGAGLHNSSLNVNGEKKLEQLNLVKNKKNIKDNSLFENKPCNVHLKDVEDTVNLSEYELTDTNVLNYTVSERNAVGEPILETKMRSPRKKEQKYENSLKNNTKHENSMKISTNYIEFQIMCDPLRDDENLKSTDTSHKNQTTLFLKNGKQDDIANEKHNLEQETDLLALLKKEENKIMFTTSTIKKMQSMKYFESNLNDSTITSEKIAEEHKTSDLSGDSKKTLDMMPHETENENSDFIDNIKPITEQNCKSSDSETQIIGNTENRGTGFEKTLLDTSHDKAVVEELGKQRQDNIACAEINLENNNSISSSADVTEVISRKNSEQENRATSNESSSNNLTSRENNMDTKSEKVEKNLGLNARLQEKRKKLLGAKAVSAEESLRKNEKEFLKQSTSLAKTNTNPVEDPTVNADLTQPPTMKRKRGRPRKSDINEKRGKPDITEKHGKPDIAEKRGKSNVTEKRGRGRPPRRKSLDDMDLLNRSRLGSRSVHHTDRLKRSKSVARGLLEIKRTQIDLEDKPNWISSHTRNKISLGDTDLLNQLKELFPVKMKQNKSVATSTPESKSKSYRRSGSEGSVNLTSSNTNRENDLDDMNLLTRYNLYCKDKSENNKDVTQATAEIRNKSIFVDEKKKFDNELSANINKYLNVDENVHAENISTPKKIDKDEGGFKLGDIAWAQIGHHPFWPCLITNEPGTKYFKKMFSVQSKRFNRELYHVRFFGDNGKRAWISKQQIMLYSNSGDLKILKNKMKSEKQIIPSAYIVKPKPFLKWKGAIEEAEKLKLKTVADRLKFFRNLFSKGNSPKQKERRSAEVVSKDTSLPTKRKSNDNKNIISGADSVKGKEPEIADTVSKGTSLPTKRKSNEYKNTGFDGDATNEKEPENDDITDDTPLSERRKSNHHKTTFTEDESTKEKESAIADNVPVKRKSNETQKVGNSPKPKEPTNSEIVTKNTFSESDSLNIESAKRRSPEVNSPKQKELAYVDYTPVTTKRKSNEHKKSEAKCEISAKKDDSDDSTPIQRRQKKRLTTENKTPNGSVSDSVNVEIAEEGAQIQSLQESIQLNESFLSKSRPRRQVDEISEVASKSSSDIVVDSDTSLNSMEAQKALYKRNNLFKGVSREKVCQNCYKPGEVLKCKGRCNGSYHISCSLKFLEKATPQENKQPITSNINSLSTNEENCKPLTDEKSDVSDVDAKIMPSEVDVNCHKKDTCVSSLKLEEQVQIITVPSSVYNTPPRKTFPPNFKNMTLAEQIDYKMKEIMRKFESKTFYSETSSESSSEDVSRVQSSLQATSIGPANTTSADEKNIPSVDATSVDSEQKREDKTHELEVNEISTSNINAVLDNLKKLTVAKKIDKQTVKKVTPILKKKLFIKHVTADSERDYIIQEDKLDRVKKNFKCGFCASDLYPNCFVCHLAVSRKGSNIRQKCSVYPCGRFYHPECLKMWPQTQWSLIQTTRHKDSDKDMDSFVCPLHVCHTCVSDDPRAATSRCSGDKIVKCLRCPSTYHSSNLCVPAGTSILSSSQIICPRHRETSKLFTINTTWCFLCSKGGNLICCETCPTSVHPECLPVNLTDDDKFICEDCESGRLPLYDEIVWVKLGKFRWWPALILFPNEVPDNIKNMKHGTGEFVVKFFGTYDYYWVNRGRSFLFQEGDTGQCNSVKKKVDLAFNTAVDEAVVAHKLKKEFKISQEAESIMSLKPPPYIRIKVNKPVGNVRHLDLDLSSTNACECDPNRPHPCGPESDCLNRLLMTECSPEVCPAGTRCKNQSFEKREYPPLVPYKTQGRGWGLRTLAPIKKGQFVIEYVGELIDSEEYQRRIQKMHEQKEENYYFLTIDKDRMIDAGPKGNAARFMNHCCQPNCETQKWTVNGDTRVGLFATEDISTDTELTFNYNLECVGKEKKVCRCGAPNCSGFIGVKAKQDTEIIRKPKKSIKKKVPVKPVVLPPCFICRKKRGLVICCNNKVCNKTYHRECLNTSEQLEGNKFTCPWHNCNLCSKRTIRCCVKCINSYCPSHADGNIRYDNLLGFICTTHDPMTPPSDVQPVRFKKKRINIITEETAVTSTTSDIDENDDWSSKLSRRRLNSRQTVSTDLESDNDSIIGKSPKSLKRQSLVPDYESQDESAVSSATPSDADDKIVVKRKRGRPKKKRKLTRKEN